MLFFGAACGASAQEADLAIIKSGPGSAAANTNVAYTLNLLNIGPDDAASVELIDFIPAGMTFVSLSSPAGWTCITPAVGSGGTVTCTNANFAAGGNVSFTLTLHIPTGTAPGTFFTNSAVAATATFDPNDENNTSSASTLVSGGASADLVVTKTAPSTIFAGQNIAYSIQTVNAGPDTASSVTLSDPLPAGSTFVSLSSPAGWTCTTPAVGGVGTVTCSIASLAAGAAGSFTLTVNVPAGTPDGTLYQNTATISSATSDPTPENNAGTAGTLVVSPSPDFSISKSHSGNATQGQTGFTYSITVTNVGSGAGSGTVTVQDNLPAGLTATTISGTGWSCTLATLTCTRSDSLAPTLSYPPITLTVNVAADAPNPVTNRAMVSNALDTNSANDIADDPTVVLPPPAPDLAITKTHSGNPPQGQTGFNYTIAVNNVGTAAASGTTTVQDTLPAGLTATAMSGSGWTCTLATLICTRADALAAGAAFPVITLTVTVASNAPASVTNSASVSNAGDTNSANDTATDPTTVTPAAPDLTITKTHSGNPLQGQTGFNYTITVSNVGNGAASGTTTVQDTLPAGLTATAMSGSGWTCTLATLICTRADALAASAAFPVITLTVTVATNAPASVTNSASVSNAGDTNSANNTATDPTTVTPAVPDLAITKTHAANAIQGQTGFTYTITVRNAGTGATSGTTTVQDTLPTGLTATAMSGSGWTCTLGTLTCTRTDALAAGATYPVITLTVNVASNAAASVTNSATVSNPSDTNTANNTATDPTVVTVGTAPDLAIAKSHSGNAQQGQTGFAYTITVSNVGTAASSGSTTVQDTLPAGLTATAMDGSGWSCTLGTLTCTRADALAVSAAFPTITLTVNVATNASSSVTNTATVSNAGDANAANDTATDPTTVTAAPLPDLAITKSHSGDAQQGQVGFAYTIAVRNVGVGASSGAVTVSDTLPAGLTATAISGAGWTCTTGGTATCSRSDALAAGASYPAITLTVNVAANAAASITNTATVSGGGDTNAANNTASDPTTVTPAPTADLAIAKTHTGSARAGQMGFVYTITVTNAGVGASSGTVTVTDLLPAKLTATAIGGSGWTCTLGTTPSCTRADALAPGAAHPPISLTVNVAGDAPPLVTNTATVSGGGDSNAANNTAADVTAVRPRADPTKDPDVVGLITAQIATAERFATTQISNFNERLEALHDDNTGDQFGLRFGQPDQDQCYIPGTSLLRDPFDPKCKIENQFTAAEASATDAFASMRTRKASANKAPPPEPRTRDFAFWTTGFVSFGSADPTVQRSSIDFNTSGASAGVDYRLGRNIIVGAGVGYGRDSSKIGERGTHSDAEAYNVAVYGSYRPFRNFFIDGLAGYGAMRFNSQRFVVDDTAFVYGTRNGSQFFSSLTAAYQFRFDRMMLSPYARINAAWLTLDAFTETGGLGGALTYSAQSVNFYTAVLGLRGKYTFLTDWGSIAPRFRVEYNHNFAGTSTIFLQYADLLGPIYSLATAPASRDRATFGVGTDLMIGDQHRFAFDYQYDADFLGADWHRFRLRWDTRFRP